MNAQKDVRCWISSVHRAMIREVGVLSNHRSVVLIIETINFSWMILPALRLPKTKYTTPMASRNIPTSTDKE